MFLNNPEVLYQLKMKDHEEMIIDAQNSRLIGTYARSGRDRKSFLNQTIIWLGYHMMTWGCQLVNRFERLPDKQDPCFSVIAQ